MGRGLWGTAHPGQQGALGKDSDWSRGGRSRVGIRKATPPHPSPQALGLRLQAQPHLLCGQGAGWEVVDQVSRKGGRGTAATLRPQALCPGAGHSFYGSLAGPRNCPAQTLSILLFCSGPAENIPPVQPPGTQAWAEDPGDKATH